MGRSAVLALALLIVAGGASAAPPKLSATLRSRPGDLQAGEPWNAEVALRRGKHALVRARAAIWIQGETGRRVFRAAATRRPGRYRARVVFPAGGIWRYGVTVGRRTIPLGAVDVRGAGPRIAAPHGLLAHSAHGDLIVADRARNAIYELNLRTRATRLVARGFEHPYYLSFGPSGHLHVGDDRRIWRLEPTGMSTPVAGDGTRGLAGDGGPATAAQLGGHGAFAFDEAGTMYIPEYDNGVRVVTPDGRIDTLAGIGREGYSGDGGAARAAAFGAPHGLDALPDGTVLVADSHNGVIRRIDGTTRIVTTIATGFSAPVAIEATADGSYYVVDARADRVYRIGADGSRRSLGRGLHTPISIAVDAAGVIYVSEFERRRIRRIDPRTGRVTTLLRP